MSRMKDLFVTFNTAISLFINKVELTGADPKLIARTGEYTKGVESDFIRIYRDRNDPSLSFSFAFNNFQPEMDNCVIIVSVRDSGSEAMERFSFEAFQAKFKEMLKVVKILENSKTLNMLTLVNTIRTVFDVKNTQSIDYRKLGKEFGESISAQLEKHILIKAASDKNKKEEDDLRKIINERVTEFKNKLETELNLKHFHEESMKLNQELSQIESEALSVLNDKIVEMKKEYSFVTYRALKNNLAQHVPVISSDRYLWRNIFQKALQNHQGHKD